MMGDAKLFNTMKDLEYCKHVLNTQMNQGMNNSIAKYTKKGICYGATNVFLFDF